MLKFISFVALSAVQLAARELPCIKASPPLSLPQCTNKCLVGDDRIIDGVCPDNLKEVCMLSDGTRIYFSTFGDCLVKGCTDEQDRWDFLIAFDDACSGLNKIFEYQALPKELYDVWRSGDPRTRTSSSTKAQETTTTHVASMIVVTISKEEKTPSSSPQPSAVVPTSTEFSNQNPQPEPASATANSQATDSAPHISPSSSPTAALIDPNVDDDPSPTHIHTTIHIHDTASPTSDPFPPSLSTPKIAAISAASVLTSLAIAIGAMFYFFRRRRRAKIVGAGEERWDPSRGMHGNESKMGDRFGREAKLPDVDIDIGRAVGGAIFEKDGTHVARELGVRGGSGGVIESAGPGQHKADGFESSGIVLTELETRDPTVMTRSPSSTLSMSPPAHGNSHRCERRWPTEEASEVHAECAGVVSPVVSELEGAHEVGGNMRYYAGRR